MPRARTHGPRDGKLLDTWYYEYKGIQSAEDEPDEDEEISPSPKQVQGIKVAVELRLHKTFRESDKPPLSVNEVWFTVECDKPKFSLKGSDIEALRAAMWENLDKHFAVKWESYFLVEIRHDHPYDGIGTGFVFSYKSVEKGTAWDDTLLLRTHEYHGREIILPWPGEFKDKEGNVMACIPATKANRKALEEYGKRIDMLRERVADGLRPHTIFKTLSAVGKHNLLAAVEEHHEQK